MSEDPTARAVRNLFAVRRLENGIVADASGFLYDLFGELVGLITKADPPSAPPGAQGRRVRALIREIRALVGPAYGKLLAELQRQLTAVGLHQADWAKGALRLAIGSDNLGAVGFQIGTGDLSAEMLRSIIQNRPFRGEGPGGALLKDWMSRQADSTVFQVGRRIQLGMAQGESIGDIVRRVRGRQAGYLRRDPTTGAFVAKGTKGAEVAPRFVGGVLQTSTRQAEALVRTAVNQIATDAHRETYAANPDVTRTYTYTAVLDSRTTPICMGLDGQVYTYDDPNAVYPPQHWNCRSTIRPNIDWQSLGLPEPDPGTRASMDGQVSASLDYQGWLKDQPAKMQDEILGPVRAALFRKGKITLKDLVNGDRKVIRIADLPGGKAALERAHAASGHP